MRQALICICFASIRQHAIDLVLFLQLSFLCSPPCCSSLLFLCVLLIVCVIVLRLLVSLSVLALLRCSSYCRFFLVSLLLFIVLNCSFQEAVIVLGDLWEISKFMEGGGKKYVMFSHIWCALHAVDDLLAPHLGDSNIIAAFRAAMLHDHNTKRVTLSQSIKNPLHVLGHILDPWSAYLEFSTQHAALLCRHPYYCLYFVASVIEFTAILFLQLLSVMKSNRYYASIWLAFFPITQTHQFFFPSFPMSQ